jgi:hypothetical protein
MATNPLNLDLDPALMQTLAEQVKNETTIRTPAEMHKLQAKRDANIKASNKVTREQRRRDVTIKLLKPNEDALRKMRSIDVFNYFVVPYEMAKSVRASIHRELSVSNKKFTTSKFKWGQHHYLKVKRVPEHGGE